MAQQPIFRTLLATASLSLCLISAAVQPRTLMQRTAFQVTSPNVAIDMKLTSAQVAARASIMDAYNKAQQDLAKQIETASGDQLTARTADLDKLDGDTQVKLIAMLTPSQQNRLRQIGIQQEGTEAIQDESVAKDLGLTAPQKLKIKAIHDATQKAQDDYQTALGEAIEKIPEPGQDEASIKAYSAKQQTVIQSMKPQEAKYLRAKAAGDNQIVAILTPAQRAKWSAMHGKPLK